jgi:hypothetical protein
MYPIPGTYSKFALRRIQKVILRIDGIPSILKLYTGFDLISYLTEAA